MDDQQLSFRFKAQELAIARLERKVNLIIEQLKLNIPDEEDQHPELAPVVAMLKKNNFMGAVTEYRKITGAPFADAQVAVQALNLKIL